MRRRELARLKNVRHYYVGPIPTHEQPGRGMGRISVFRDPPPCERCGQDWLAPIHLRPPPAGP